MIEVSPSIAIDENELHFEFAQASGPGGQNVNKVATAVRLRFDAANSPNLSEEVRRRLLTLAAKRATADGIVMIEAKRFRTQLRNREVALTQLLTLIRRAATPPKPRRKSTPSPASRAARLEAKRRRSATKTRRRSDQRDE